MMRQSLNGAQSDTTGSLKKGNVMSAKDAFFQKVEENINAQQASQDALKKTVQEFQDGTSSLVQTIKAWFDASPIKVSVSTCSCTAWDMRFDAHSLELRNGDKTLTIVPEGLGYIGVAGVVKVTINNPNRSPRRSEFSIHWRDRASKHSEWMIVVGTSPIQRIEFNQESFFSHISSFA